MIDKDTLRKKYANERDKRLRPDGNDQYVRLEGQLSHYLDDPYVPRVEREPLTDEVTVAFIGGGFAGLVTGARLTQAGVDDVRLIEKGGDFGGTWYWNRYPGAQCDTDSFVYMPLLEETGHMPTEKYAARPRDPRARRRIGRHFDLYDNALFQTEVTDVRRGTSRASRWVVRTNRGDEMRAQFVVVGTGPLHKPKLPGIPGIESFTGHSSTPAGGTTTTPAATRRRTSTGCADKRVAIIGTGATAVQVHPAPGAGLPGAVRLPAHAVVDRRPRQRPDRPRVVRAARSTAGLAAASGWRTSARSRPAASPTRTW